MSVWPYGGPTAGLLVSGRPLMEVSRGRARTIPVPVRFTKPIDRKYVFCE